MKTSNPQLRFKKADGTSYPDWTTSSLGEVLDYEQPTKYIVNSVRYDPKYPTPVLTANKGFILGYTDEIFDLYTDTPVIIFDDFTTDNKYVDFPFKVKSSALKILKPINDNNIKYLYEAIQVIDFKIGAHKRHWISEYSKLEISLPCLEEQNKIAECLTSLDELINTETKQYDDYKEYKQGLLQKLFPKNGEKKPELRFPGFTEDWATMSLSEVCTYKKGGQISKSELSEDGNPCILYGELYTRYHECITHVYNKTNKSVNTKSQKHDIIIPTSGETAEDIALATSCVLLDNVILGGDMMILSPNKMTNGIFLTYYIIAIYRKITPLAQGVSVVHLYWTSLQNLQIPLPCLEEQKKIAECLTSLDDLITTQNEKIDKLKIYKQGLMQQLFPRGGK